MKISKFNENSQNLTLDKLKKNSSEIEYLEDVFTNYLIWKDDDISEDDGCYITDYFFKGDIFIINYNTNDDNGQSHYVDDMDELIEFINDPEMIKNKGKYNL